MKTFLVSLLLGAVAMAEDTYVRKIQGEVDAWSCSGSPEYYKGEGQRGGVDLVQDPDRGEVLRCRFGFGDPAKSEPIFLTRKLSPQPPRLDVLAVRFQAKLTAPIIDPDGGFILRLRTSDTAHDNWNVQKLLGKAFPVGEWVQVEVPTAPDKTARNIWGKVFGNVRQMTFRLDDIDEQNGAAELLLANIELVLAKPPAEESYTPQIAERPTNKHPRVLLLHHAAAGYYRIPEALAAVAKDVQIESFPYRGRHFEFFGLGKERKNFLLYDAIILLDIDPFVLDTNQARGIADAVASGASLVSFAGSSSFCAAKGMPAALREAFPVTFAAEAKASGSTVAPKPGEAHALNTGFDPVWLGHVAYQQPLVPKPDTVVPWTAGKLPLVVCSDYHAGRTVVVNAQAQYLRLGQGDFYLSPLADDFMRRLMAYALRREPVHGIQQCDIGVPPIGGGTVAGKVATDADVQVLLDGASVPVAADGTFSLALPSPKEAEESHQVRVEARTGRTLVDWRDLDLVVRHPLLLRTVWRRNRSCFVPGGRVEFSLDLNACDVPPVTPGQQTEIRYLNRWPLSVDSFADVWLKRDGQTYHNQRGPTNVKVETTPGIRPSYHVSGVAHAARPAENSKYAEDDRILDCQRAIRCLPAGLVEIDNDFRVRQDLQVHRLPLTISLPAATYAGLPYQVTTGGKTTTGRFPEQAAKEHLFDVTGGVLKIETSDGPIRIEPTDPAIRFWCQDLRRHDMPSFRIEVEAPLPTGAVPKGTSYRIPIRVQGPVPGGALPAVGELAFTAALHDQQGRCVWNLPPSRDGRFATDLPTLGPGRYELRSAVATDAGPVVARRDECLVAPPLPKDAFYPLMCYVDFTADGHVLDPEGMRAHLQEMRDAGFNTAAITSPTALASESPSPGRDARALAERIAVELGMAVSFEYSNFTTYRRRGPQTPCPFSPEGREALERHLAPRIDVANRTARLLTAKVVDEPHLSLKDVDWSCPYCQAEFKRLYGIDMEDTEGSKAPYALWCRADFAGQLVDQVFRLGAECKAANATGSWELLLTYMAMGLGYQNPQSTVQDALDWTRHAGWADFDIYPYFYPASQRVRMVQASYGMSYMREISRARRVPWGFYVELDDRNWPFQKNPREASADCAFTAVAHGADYLNTFIHKLASTGCGARPERWALAEEAFRQIERLGPKLASLPALRSRLALVHPNAHEKISNGYQRPDHTLELLKGVFGDIDVLPEQLLRESGEIPYAALLLLDVEYLHADTVGPLQRWLAAGGTLICDRLPTRTHRDQPIVWTELGTALAGPDSVRIRPAGKGRIAFLPENPEPILQDLAEAAELDPPALSTEVLRLADSIEQVAGRMPIRTSVRDLAAADPCVDTVVVGIRGNDAERLLTVVNHRHVPVEATIRLRDEANWRYDDALGSPLPLRADRNSVTIAIPPRGHRVIHGEAARAQLRTQQEQSTQ